MIPKAGRGSENKVSFIAAVETNQAGHPVRAVFSRVKTFSLAEIESWARNHLAASATVVSDGLNCFPGVSKAGCQHEPEVVGKTRKSTCMPCFKWVNTVLGNLKTATSGTYHAFDRPTLAERCGLRPLWSRGFRGAVVGCPGNPVSDHLRHGVSYAGHRRMFIRKINHCIV